MNVEYKEKVLDNGLRIAAEYNQGMKSVTIGFFVKTGSRDEPQNLYGISHFLEHMAFKRTKSMNWYQLNIAFDSIGAVYNAMTSHEYTVFFARVLPEYVENILKIHSEMMQPVLSKEDFEIERNVILEEINLYEDLPEAIINEYGIETYFTNHPLGHRVIGTRDSIKSMQVEDMRKYFEERYVANNILCCCVGNFDWENLVKLIEKYCNDWQKKDVKRIHSNFEHISGSKIILRKDLNLEYILLLTPAPSFKEEIEEAEVISTIIGDARNSRLYWSLLDKGLVENVSMYYSPFDEVGIFGIGISCKPENVNNVMSIVSNEMNNAFKISENELNIAKNKIIASVILTQEYGLYRFLSLGNDLIHDLPYKSIDEEIKSYQKITINDIIELSKKYPMKSWTKVFLGPLKENEIKI